MDSEDKVQALPLIKDNKNLNSKISQTPTDNFN